MYEELKEVALLWKRAKGGTDTASLTGPESRALNAGEASACGAASKVIAGIVTYPTQVVKSRWVMEGVRREWGQ